MRDSVYEGWRFFGIGALLSAAACVPVLVFTARIRSAHYESMIPHDKLYALGGVVEGIEITAVVWLVTLIPIGFMARRYSAKYENTVISKKG